MGGRCWQRVHSGPLVVVGAVAVVLVVVDIVGVAVGPVAVERGA